MLYITADLARSKGNHGHQLKSLFGIYMMAKIIGAEYVHTDYPYLDFFALGDGEKKVGDLNKDIRTFLIEDMPVRNLRDASLCEKVWKETLDKILDIKNSSVGDCLIVIGDNMRFFEPEKIISLIKKGKMEKDVFDETSREVSGKYFKKNFFHTTCFDKKKLSIAMHINRGIDYDRIKYPQHFSDSRNARFIFPMAYYKEIKKNLDDMFLPEKYDLHIYTERLNSEEIVEVFGPMENVILHIGDNRDQRNYGQVHGIFDHFVKSDIFVACNSSFSMTACYFRHGRPIIYHPNKYLGETSYANYIPTDLSGNFDKKKLMQNILRLNKK